MRSSLSFVFGQIAWKINIKLTMNIIYNVTFESDNNFGRNKKDKIKQEYCYIFFLNFNIEEIKKAPWK